MQHYKHSQNKTLIYNHSYHRNYVRCHLPSGLLIVFIMSFFLLVSCEKKCVTFTAEERKAADSVVKSVAGVDSLSLLQKRLEKKGDKLGSIVALREWGKLLRGESRFEEALSVHSKG